MATAESTVGLVNSKWLVVVGGYTDVTQIFNFETNLWTLGSKRPVHARGDHHGGVTIGDKFYLFGGFSCDGRLIHSYTIATDTWATDATKMPLPLGSPAVVAVGTTVYLCGGVDNAARKRSRKCFSRDMATDRSPWSELADMPEGVHHTAHGTDGKSMFIFGGKTLDRNGNHPGTNFVQRYNIATGVWSEQGPMPCTRGGTGHAPFYDGEFYIMGGERGSDGMSRPDRCMYGTGGTFSQVLIFNPTTATWRFGPQMPVGMHGIFPVIDPERSAIYVASGGDRYGVSSTTRFDILQLYGADPERSSQQLNVDDAGRAGSRQSTVAQPGTQPVRVAAAIGTIAVAVVVTASVLHWRRRRRRSPAGVDLEWFDMPA